MNKHLTITAGLISAALTGSAIAADMPLKAPPPVAVAAYSWTGCYVGGHVGVLWYDKEWTLNRFDNTPVVPFSLGDHRGRGPLGGVQVGCNYQANNWVFGIQGDYAWTDGRGRHRQLTGPLTTLYDASNVKSLGSVTGRLGYAWDRSLWYVKGGWAWERDRYNIQGNDDGAVSLFAGETRTGWTVGVGWEYAMTSNWSGFFEFDHYDFGTKSLGFERDVFAVAGGPAVRTYTLGIDIRERKEVFKIGVNYKFGGAAVVAAAPVISK